MKTQVILQKDVPNLGMTGDVVGVARGYARNFLLPEGLAVMATAGGMERVKRDREQRVEDNKAKLAAAKDEAARVKEAVCTFHVRAGEDGKLFGAVTTADVARSLAEKGITVDKRQVEIAGPVRTVGEYTGTVRLHPQVRASFKIVVQPAG